MSIENQIANIKSVISYDSGTGCITRLVSSGNSAKGDVVGCLNSEGYLIVWIDKKNYKCHSLAWLCTYGHWPKNSIDHINGIRSDNRIENLRDVSHEDNMKNQKIRSDNKSCFVGVSLLRGKWVARINHNKKTMYLGIFDKKEDAIKAREDASVKYGYHKNHGRKV